MKKNHVEAYSMFAAQHLNKILGEYTLVYKQKSGIQHC